MGTRVAAVTIALSSVSLLCWLVMFLAGTDAWHDTGRPDFWRLDGPPYADLRAFAYSFYLLLAPLVASLFVQVVALVQWRRTRSSV